MSGNHHASPSRARVGVILAGGASRRMPGGKPSALVGGVPLLTHAITRVAAAGLQPVVCSRPSVQLPPHAARALVEPETTATPHPLRGIAHALQVLAEPLVVIPVDLPFLPARAISALATRPETAAVLAVDGAPAALVARLSPDLAPELMAAAEAGAGVMRTLLAVGATPVEAEQLEIDDLERDLLNVNAPDDLARAEQRYR